METEDAHNIDEMVDRACSIAYREGFAQPGERIIITAGVPFGTSGATNLLRIAFIGPDGCREFDHCRRFVTLHGHTARAIPHRVE